MMRLHTFKCVCVSVCVQVKRSNHPRRPAWAGVKEATSHCQSPFVINPRKALRPRLLATRYDTTTRNYMRRALCVRVCASEWRFSCSDTFLFVAPPDIISDDLINVINCGKCAAFFPRIVQLMLISRSNGSDCGSAQSSDMVWYAAQCGRRVESELCICWLDYIYIVKYGRKNGHFSEVNLTIERFVQN